MLDTSICCTNTNTYGISCVKCGKCGRKFTSDGVDDSEVIAKNVKEYREFLNSDLFNGILSIIDDDRR